MSHIRLVFLVTFAASLVAIIQSSHAFQSASGQQQVASSSSEENQQHPAPEPYSFSYTAESNGGLSKHQESGDGSGRVTGFYTIMGDDGRERRVDYIADADGYRAQISTNEVGTRAQSSANADYQVQLPSAGQLEAAKISYEQYKYLEDTHATERQRVFAQSSQSHKQGHFQQTSTADFNRQQQAQPQFVAGQTSATTFQRGSSGSQFQEGQLAAVRPVTTTSGFGNSIGQGANSAAAISTSVGTLDDQNDLDWRKAKLLDTRNRTVAKFGSANEFSSASPALTLTQETPLNSNQQQLSNQANRQHYSASSGGGRDSQAAGLTVNADQARQSNYERFQAQQQQVQQKQKPSNFSNTASYQQGQNYLGSTNTGRAPEFNNRKTVLQGQLEQQFLIQASGDQDYMRQTNSPVFQQTAVTSIPDQSSRFQVTNAQAIGGQQRDENLLVTEERPTIPIVVPQIVTTIATTEPQQVSSWSQQTGRGSSTGYSSTGNERDYQQVTANQQQQQPQQQGDNNALVNDSNQFTGAYQEQTNILNNVNQVDEKNELQQDLQQGGQVDQQDVRNQQQTLVSNQQGVTVQAVTSRPTPSGLISINLSGNQEQEEVGTEKPTDEQQQITGNQNFSVNTQTQGIPQQQRQFTTIQYQQPVKTTPTITTQQVVREQNQVQPIFRQNFSQTGFVENNRPNSINQIIENITRQPIVQVESEVNQFGRQEGRFEQQQELQQQQQQQQQGFRGAARPSAILMRTETAKATTANDRLEPISEVSITTTNLPLFSRQEVQQETTTERVTYYQPTTAPTTTSTSTTTTTTARPSTTSTTTTPEPTVEITRQTLVPTQRLTETTTSFLRPVQQQQQQQQVVVQGGVKGGRKKAPTPLIFNRQNFNRTNEFSYNQLPLNAPSIEPERVSYVTITTRAPLRTTTSYQANNLQRVEQQAPYLSSISSQIGANLDSSERPFTRYTNATRGEARTKTQAQIQPQQQIQQLQQVQQLPQIQIQPQSNTSFAQVSTVSQFPNEATYVTAKPIQQAQAQTQTQTEAKQQQSKGGIKGGSSSANKRQFWQQRTVPTANQELMRAMRSLTSSVSYVDQAQDNKRSRQQPVSTRKAASTSAEDYDNLRSFGYRFEAVTQST